VDGIFPFITRGWRLDEPLDFHSALRSVRAFLFGTEYLNAPVSPLYVFGRTQDMSLQKARDKISLRNHLRVWLAPFTINGQHVWVGQISRDIGIKLTTQSWYLTTHRISPDVDQDRYYLLQDLILTGEVSRFGFVRGVGTSSKANPRTNLTGDPYLTDGLRLACFSAPNGAHLVESIFSNGSTRRHRRRDTIDLANSVRHLTRDWPQARIICGHLQYSLVIAFSH
jgi:hypothetical protein